MKKMVIIVGIAAFLLFIIAGFLLNSIVLWQGLYPNNSSLTVEENEKIKAVLLGAVKDRCSVLYKVDTNEIYDMDSATEIIQNEEQAAVSKSLICLVDPGFMRTVAKTEDGGYQATVKMFYPETYYYCFEIHVIDGKYLITSFKLDI